MLKVKKYKFPTLSVSCCQIYYPYLTCDNLSNQIITQIMLKHSGISGAANNTCKSVPICYHHAVIPLYFKNHEHFTGCSENDSRDALSPWEMFCTGKGITRGNVHWTFPRVTELCAVSFRHPGKCSFWKSHGTVLWRLENCFGYPQDILKLFHINTDDNIIPHAITKGLFQYNHILMPLTDWLPTSKNITLHKV